MVEKDTMSAKNTPKKRKMGEVDSMLTSPNKVQAVKFSAEVTPAILTSPNPSTPAVKTSRYLDEMEKELKATPKVFNDFLTIMKKFKSESIPTSDVVIQVRGLLKNHDNLWKGFQEFLPEGTGHQLVLTDE